MTSDGEGIELVSSFPVNNIEQFTAIDEPRKVLVEEFSQLIHGNVRATRNVGSEY